MRCRQNGPDFVGRFAANVKSGKETWRERTSVDAQSFVAVFLDANGNTVFYSSRDETIQRGDTKFGHVLTLFRWHDEGIRGFAISADSHVATAGHSAPRQNLALRTIHNSI